MIPCKRVPGGCAVAGLLLWAWPWRMAAEVTLQPLMLRGEATPSFESGFVFSSFFPPLLSDGGQVQFQALTHKDGGSPIGGVWSRLSSNQAFFSLLVRQGEEAPGAAGASFTSFDTENLSLGFNDAGIGAFTSTLTGPGVIASGTDANASGIWAGRPLLRQLYVRQGDSNPADPTERFLGFNHYLRVNDSGMMAFRGSAAGPNTTAQSQAGIWRSMSGGLTEIVRSGDETGVLTSKFILGSGGPFEAPTLNVPHLNAAGEVVFLSRMTGQGIEPRGIFFAGAGGLKVVAHSMVGPNTFVVPVGNEAVGIPGDRARITNLYQPALNSAGQMAFRANVSSLEMVGDAIYLGTLENMQLIARSGAEAPGTGGQTFGFSGPGSNNPAFGPEVDLNESGVVLFTATLFAGESNPVATSLWRATPNTADLIVRTGTGVPGAPGFQFRGFTKPRLSTNGQVAFGAEIANPDTFESATGLWATTPGGPPELIVRTGQDVELQPGDRRTVTALTFSDQYFNNDGQLACLLFLSHPVRGATSGLFLAGTRENPGIDYFWRGLGALDTNWHTTAGSDTNWYDNRNAVRRQPPSDSPGDRVTIRNAPLGGVILDRQDVTVKSLDAEGGLKVRRNLTLLEHSNISGLETTVPSNYILPHGELTLRGVNTLLNGGILGAGVPSQLIIEAGSDVILGGTDAFAVIGLNVINRGRTVAISVGDQQNVFDFTNEASGVLELQNGLGWRDHRVINRGKIFRRAGASANRYGWIQALRTEPGSLVRLEAGHLDVGSSYINGGQFDLMAGTELTPRGTMVAADIDFAASAGTTGSPTGELRTSALVQPGKTVNLDLDNGAGEGAYLRVLDTAGDVMNRRSARLDILQTSNAGRFINTAGGILRLGGSGTETGLFHLDGFLINHGRMVQDLPITITTNGRLHNKPDSELILSQGVNPVIGTVGEFINEGRISHTGAGTTSINHPLTLQGGNILVSAGELVVERKLTSLAGTTLEVRSGAHLKFDMADFAGDTLFTGQGRITVTGAVNVTGLASLQLHTEGLVVSMLSVAATFQGQDADSIINTGPIRVVQGGIGNLTHNAEDRSPLAFANPQGARASGVIRNNGVILHEEGSEEVALDGEMFNQAGARYTVSAGGWNFESLGNFHNDGLLEYDGNRTGTFAKLTLKNAGTLNLKEGRSLQFAEARAIDLQNLGGGKRELVRGKWILRNASRLTLTEGSLITRNAANIELHGNANFASLSRLDLENNGTFSLLDGASLRMTGQFENNGTLIIGPGCFLVANEIDNDGETKINGEITADVTCSSSATFTGSGKLNGNALIAGETLPANSPGRLTVGGHFTQLDTASLIIEIAGLVPGESHDQLVVHGNAALAGRLELHFTDGFAPRQGDVFAFMQIGGTLTGGFTEVRFPNLRPGFQVSAPVFAQGVLSVTALTDGQLNQTPGGIPFAWLLDHALPTAGAVDSSDPDGDGMSVIEEWIAGTDPTNRRSLLSLETPRLTSTGALLAWDGVAGRRYTLYRSGTLAFEEWIVLHGPIDAVTDGSMSHTDVHRGGTQYYRLQVGHP